MIKIDILRRQHGEALSMAQRLLELIENYQPGSPSFPVLLQLNRLYGVLRIHLAQEDVQLYPALMTSADRKVAYTAKLFAREMGDLATDLECFARHWSCSASITNNFDEFREAANELILALAVRLEREDQHLYPLAETEIVHRRDAA